jgi:molecular chaperone GrpE
MTSGRRPAGAPEEQRKPAGVPVEGQVEEAGPASPGTDGEFVADTDKKSPPAAEANSAAAVDADLDALLADTERQRDEYLELARRTKADFENYRKRASRETDEAERRGKASLARDLIPSLDSLERALQSAGVTADGEGDVPEEPQSREVSAHEALAQGMQLVLRELQSTLARTGVEAFAPTGETFDPAWHEALATRPADADSGTVVETLEKGYRLDGQLIRPARVVVAE